MSSFILVVHLLLAVGIVGLVLMQKSEGGGLGMGSASTNTAGFAPRPQGDLLTKATTYLAAAFFFFFLILGILAHNQAGTRSIVDNLAKEQTAPAESSNIDAKNTPVPADQVLPAPISPANSPATSPASAPAEPQVPLAQ